MPFLNPTVFFTGLGLASAPIIIHLLNRRRYRIRDWAAMRFLLESMRKNRKRLRIEELILLAIRTLVVIALAVALGRFLGCGQTLGGLAGDQSRGVVFVLDDSYSMGQAHTEQALFDLAKADLIERLDDLAETDQVTILLTSEPDEPYFGPATVTDKQSVVTGLRTLEISDLRTGLNRAVERAGEILISQAGQRDLYLLSDLRRVDLADKARAQDLRTRLEDLRNQQVSLRVLDYGLEPQRNVTVESVQLLDRFAAVGSEAHFQVTVRNNSPVTLGDVKLQMVLHRIEDEQIEEVKLPALDVTAEGSLAPGQTRKVEYVHAFNRPGSVVLRAEAASDDLGGDNAGQLALRIQETVRVAIIDGRPALRPRDRESSAMVDALDPTGTRMFGIEPTVYTPDEIGLIDFDRYEMVALLNVPDFPQQLDAQGQPIWPKVRELERYVAGGGGLMIFTGDRLSLQFYNGPMYADGGGLMPFKIGAPVEAKRYFRMQPVNVIDHPVLGQIESGFASVGLSFTAFIRFYAITPADEAMARTAPEAVDPIVITRFNDPEARPAIVETPLGEGKVVTIFSTASNRWNDWPKDETGTYVWMLQDMVHYLARTHKARYTARVGEPVIHEVPRELDDTSATLTFYPSADLGTRKARRQAQDVLVEVGELAEALPAERAQPIRDGADRLSTALREMDYEQTPTNRAQVASAATQLAEALEAEQDDERSEKLARRLKSDTSELLRYVLRWDGAPHAGIYGVHLDAPADDVREAGQLPTVLYVRNTDPVEGQLSPAGADEIENILGEVAYYDARAGKDSGKSIAAAADAEDWWVIAMVSMVVLMAAELFLGQKFGHYDSDTTPSRS
jgi:hypothetical protein